MTGVTANLPNLMVKAEDLDTMVGRSRVAFVFDGMEKRIRKTLGRKQFEHVVILSATRSMGYPLKLLASTVNSLKRLGLRFKAKYLTANTAIRQYGHYNGPLEAAGETDKPAYLFSSSGTSGNGYANQIGIEREPLPGRDPFLLPRSALCVHRFLYAGDGTAPQGHDRIPGSEAIGLTLCQKRPHPPPADCRGHRRLLDSTD